MKTISATAALLSVVACGAATTSTPDTGDGGTDRTPTVACTDCLATTVNWGGIGGNSTSNDFSMLDGCRTYTRTRAESGKPNVQCTSEIGACGPAPIAAGDVEAALAHPDVVAAFKGTTKTYGLDDRACDGGLLAIRTGTTTNTLEVGNDCPAEPRRCSASPCVPVPSGVRALATLLVRLDMQEVPKPACAALQ